MYVTTCRVHVIHMYNNRDFTVITLVIYSCMNIPPPPTERSLGIYEEIGTFIHWKIMWSVS